MKEKDRPFNYSERKQRDNDVSKLFEFKSNEEIIATCREAVAQEQQQKLLALLRNEKTLSVERFLNLKICNRK